MYTHFQAAEFKNNGNDQYFYLQLKEMLELVKKWEGERDGRSTKAIYELIAYKGTGKIEERVKHWKRVVKINAEYSTSLFWRSSASYPLDAELSKKANDDAQRLGKKLIQLKNWYERIDRSVWLELVKMSNSYLRAVEEVFGETESVFRTEAAKYFYYDETRKLIRKEVYLQNKKEKEGKEWTLDQLSPEEIQERDRLIVSIKNLKDAFSTFAEDIEPDLEEFDMDVAETAWDPQPNRFRSRESLKFESAEYYLKNDADALGSSDETPFETKKDALAFCERKIIDEMLELKRKAGKKEVAFMLGDGGYFWGCIWGSWLNDRSELYNVWTPGNENYSIGETISTRPRRRKKEPNRFLFGQRSSPRHTYKDVPGIVYDYGSEATEKEVPDKCQVRITLRRDTWKNDEKGVPDYMKDSPYSCGASLFDTDGVWLRQKDMKDIEEQQHDRCKAGANAATKDAAKPPPIVTPPQSPRKTTTISTEIESLKAEYSRLQVLIQEFIQGAEEDIKD